MLIELETDYTTITNSILFAKSNILHPFVMTPYQLISELRKTLPYIHNTISYYVMLPLEAENAYKLVEHVNLKVYFNNNKIIYIISNPLVNNVKYNLYKLIPLPIIRLHNNLLFILPSINYLAFSEDKHIYTVLKTRDMYKSTSIKNLICSTNQPFYNVHLRPICDTTVFSTQIEIWHKLESSNSWLYVLLKSTQVTISCISHPTSNVILSKTGLLTINKNCKIYTSYHYYYFSLFTVPVDVSESRAIRISMPVDTVE